MEKSSPLTVVIIARNEAEIIKDCFASLNHFAPALLIDTGSTDQTTTLARQARARVLKIPFKGCRFSAWRNLGLKKTTTPWLLYLDADEQLTPALKKEIAQIIKSSPQKDQPVAYAIPRQNYFLGKKVHHGGSWPDHVIRLFYRPALTKWTGAVHEQPQFKGSLGYLKNPLQHYTHRDLSSMLKKTIAWTEIEADLLYKANHPPVVPWRILRMMFTKFWGRVIKQSAWQDGSVGLINAFFEVFNTFIIYARLWEKQQRHE